VLHQWRIPALVLLAMRSALVIAFAVVGVRACEQRFSSNPPIDPGSFAAAPSSSGSSDPLVGPNPADNAPAAQKPSHAMTIMLCSTSQPACPASEADASPEARYRVVFGSGHAVIRSRGQAMTDLYTELRDRTSAGERLDAEARASGDAGAAAMAGDHAKTGTASSDAFSQCAFHLLALVDGGGEVALDVVHGYGERACLVSLGGPADDAGAGQCLVQEPEHPHRPGRGSGKGIAF
jgi:hypothetical protein